MESGVIRLPLPVHRLHERGLWGNVRHGASFLSVIRREQLKAGVRSTQILSSAPVIAQTRFGFQLLFTRPRFRRLPFHHGHSHTSPLAVPPMRTLAAATIPGHALQGRSMAERLHPHQSGMPGIHSPMHSGDRAGRDPLRPRACQSTPPGMTNHIFP
jgi:hypothetical protein